MALTLKTKLGYGFGDLGAAIVAAVGGFFLNAFLLEVALLPAGLVGIIFLIATASDAITDPLMGNLSDRTRTRWGRRRPYLLFGAIPFGLAYFLHWLVPPLGEGGLFVYYLVVAILLKLGFTAVNIPYASLTAEMTTDANERTRLTAYRFSFSILGGVSAVGLHPVLVGLGGEDIKLGYLISAGIMAVLIAVSSLVAFGATHEPDPETLPKTAPFSFFEGLRVALGNRPFLFVTGIYLCSWLALQLIQTNLVLFVRYWLNADDLLTLLLLVLQVTAFAFLPVWSWVSARTSKARAYLLGALIWCGALAALAFVPQGEAGIMPVIAFFSGIGVSVAYLIPWSMLPDVVDYDELQTGQRREGVYYGFFVFIQKIGLSLGLAASNGLLGLAGYINPETAGAIVQQPDAVLGVLRGFVSVLPIVILLISLPLALRYPLTPQAFRDVQAQLQAKK